MAKNTYNISFGGKKETVTGSNIESALTDYGFTDIHIIPLWRGKSNGKYKAHCSNNTVVSVEWIEKINELQIN